MNLIDIFLIVVSLTTASLSFVITRGENLKSSKVFAIFILSIGLWGYGLFLYRNVPSLELTLFASCYNYVIALIIATLFLHFSFLFPLQKNISKLKIVCIYLPSFILGILFIINHNLIVASIYISDIGDKLVTINIQNYICYSVVFCMYWIIIYINLFKSYFSSKNIVEKTQLKFILTGTLIPLIIATYFDLVLAAITFRYVWIGPLMGFIVVCVILYAVYKHHLFNLKLIVAELITFALWIIIFIRTLLASTPDELLIEGILLCITIIIGTLLIHSVIRESKQKEELRNLNLLLATKVLEQTAEIRHAYELEKKARRELEKLNETKDQFILITQHAIRTPVTIARLEMDSILKEEYGELKTEQRKALKTATGSLARLTKIVDDFLAITAIKPGGNILNLVTVSLKPVIEDIIAELDFYINGKKLTIDYPSDEHSWTPILIDSSKMREALLIIIENAIRYNKDGGKVTIETTTKENGEIFELSVLDTGVGISSEDKEKILGQLFHRGTKAREVNPIGMGVGLSVARAIIRAHHGEVEIESPGEGRGTRVVVRFRVENLKG